MVKTVFIFTACRNIEIRTMTTSGKALHGRLSLCFCNVLLSFIEEILCSGDFRQGSSNNSVTNFVQGFPYVFQREK